MRSGVPHCAGDGESENWKDNNVADQQGSKGLCIRRTLSDNEGFHELRVSREFETSPSNTYRMTRRESATMITFRRAAVRSRARISFSLTTKLVDCRWRIRPWRVDGGSTSGG